MTCSRDAAAVVSLTPPQKRDLHRDVGVRRGSRCSPAGIRCGAEDQAAAVGLCPDRVQGAGVQSVGVPVPGGLQFSERVTGGPDPDWCDPLGLGDRPLGPHCRTRFQPQDLLG
ncbi:hypothetical protein Pta02_72560 [Planobispora takensis]|uniref:Uncharacterized protein n=1 Tax=Planobispora takensis TaxID=1367882 RepID=A0A8J3T3X3_9ACTN|nr:hypothetical protein Pta02_72560 [Planobispora takensis]